MIQPAQQTDFTSCVYL